MGRSRTGDRGSAVVEFALVSVLLVGLFLAVLQVGVALHVRNTLVAAAAEGARYGADADRLPADGAQRTREVIASSLPASFADDVTAGYSRVGGLATVVVEVRAPLPLFGMAGPGGDLVVQGHALAEQLP
jgi:Flp pilus assembly protein TadG